jgi:kynurenine formamidase
VEKNKVINESIDVSGSSDGVCIVTRTILLSNSHAGTHADQPAHFEKNPTFDYFDDLQYNGPCIVLNIANLDTAIQIDHIQQFITNGSIDPEKVTRILLHTRNTPSNDQEWTDTFAYFDPKCAEWLVSTFPHLVLIGIDTPSMDHPSASPIICHSHGALWRQRVAILENLKLDEVMQQRPVVQGYLQTMWNPMQVFKDAKGCLVRLYEEVNSVATDH